MTTAVLAFTCGLLARILGGGIADCILVQNWGQHQGFTAAGIPLLYVTGSRHIESSDASHVRSIVRELQGDLREPLEAENVPLIARQLHIKPTTADNSTAVHVDVAPERDEHGRKFPHDPGDDEDAEAVTDEHTGHEDHEPGVERHISRAVASMTLGSVVCQMTLFYLVNHKDPDMRRYSYGVIGETISIFCAVLAFNTGYSWVAEYTDKLSNRLQGVALACMVIFFWIFMESVVVMFSRVRGEKAHRRSLMHGKELSVLKHVLNARTFGAGAAQMCGAACVRAFGHLQLRAYHDFESVWLAIGVVPLTLLLFLSLMWLSLKVRNAVIFMDGIVGETELTWAEVAEECENEVCGLCMGFLLATVARILFTGSLPYILMNALKQSDEKQEATLRQVSALFVFGLISLCMTFSLVLLTFGHLDPHVDHDTVHSKFSHRSMLLVIKTLGFNFSWCFCFVMHFLGIHFQWYPEGIRLRLILALFQSAVSMLFIQLLDIISNMKYGGHSLDKAITTLNESLAVSIGLSWEHAFHACVDLAVDFMVEDKVVFTHSNDPKVWSAVLTLLICIIVLPAYRLYIVPTKYHLWEQFENGMKIKSQHFRMSREFSVGRTESRQSAHPVHELSEYPDQLHALLQRQQQACESRTVMRSPK